MSQIKSIVVFVFLLAIKITNAQTDSTSSDNVDSLQEDNVFNVPTITLEDAEVADEGTTFGDNGVSSLLSAGRDVFNNTAVFNWSIARFKIRGYDNDHFITLMNGAPTEYIDNGFGTFNLWAGLNDVTRSRDNSIGLKSTNYSFGALGGIYTIDSRASKQRKQKQITIGTSNRTYDLRGGFTWGSGITKKNWAFAASIFGRWAKNGYIEGTAMQSISYFASIEKLWRRNSLCLTTYGAPTKQGKATATTQEAYDLAGSNYYNPNWGYQNGEVRSARIEYRHQPVFILTNEFKIDENKNLVAAASYSFGERSLSRLDRFQAADPRPDYYKYLPSYSDDSTTQVAIAQFLKENPEQLQIRWDELYEANRLNGDTARYILGDQVQSHQRANLNLIYNMTVKQKLDVSLGATYQFQNTKDFKRVRDLLGASTFYDVDEFALEDSLYTNPSVGYNDVDRSSQLVGVGDKYGYNYGAIVHKLAVWGQATYHSKYIDASLGAQFSNTMQSREGYFRNGINPNNSKGRSDKVSSINYGVRAGLTFKINGRNYIYANGLYFTRAPYWNKLFLNARTSNDINADVLSEKIGSFEAGYVLNHPKVRLRATGYYTKFNDGSSSLFFYDDDRNTFSTYTITNIDKVHYGGELALDATIYKGLSATLAVAAGNYYFTSRQIATETFDAIPNERIVETLYTENFKIANTPQQAYSLGLRYQGKKFWWLSANVNFFDWMYTEIAPNHRTERATDLVPYQSEQWNTIVQQERRSQKGEWTIDLSGGYTWYFNRTFKSIKNRNAAFVINGGISNLTNNKNITVAAREQLRFDYVEKDANKFPARYSYAFGLNYYINLSFRF